MGRARRSLPRQVGMGIVSSRRSKEASSALTYEHQAEFETSPWERRHMFPKAEEKQIKVELRLSL